jgi:hypothetical protein
MSKKLLMAAAMIGFAFPYGALAAQEGFGNDGTGVHAVKPAPLMPCGLLEDQDGNASIGVSNPEIALDLSDSHNPVYYILIRPLVPGEPVNYIRLQSESSDRTSPDRIEIHGNETFTLWLTYSGGGLSKGHLESGKLKSECGFPQG